MTPIERTCQHLEESALRHENLGRGFRHTANFLGTSDALRTNALNAACRAEARASAYRVNIEELTETADQSGRNATGDQ